ncbi:MAG: fused MFS/spermidine synthase, partial [Myxococcales bacterium]
VTEEWFRLLRSRLKDDGVLMVTVLDLCAGGELLPSVIRTIQGAFPHVELLTADKRANHLSNIFLLFASERPLDWPGMRERLSPYLNAALLEPIAADRVGAYLSGSRSGALTDAYAPVDLLMAPLIAAQVGNRRPQGEFVNLCGEQPKTAGAHPE